MAMTSVSYQQHFHLGPQASFRANSRLEEEPQSTACETTTGDRAGESQASIGSLQASPSTPGSLPQTWGRGD